MAAASTSDSPAERTVVLMGASGDLAERLLIPGLGSLLASDRGLPVRLVGTGRTELDAETWRARVAEAFASVDAQGERVEQAVRTTCYVAGDSSEPEHLRALLAEVEGEPLLYFGLPPGVVLGILEALREVDLPEGTVLGFDKPFGTDADSARALTAAAHALVPEEQVHRTDHFLGEQIVQAVLALRRPGSVLDRLLTREHVERVDVIWDETLALEGRAGFYDSSGALADMVQSHLLHVVAALALEPASSDAWEQSTLHEALQAVLEHTSVAEGDLGATTRRSRYTAGEVDDERVIAYVEEEGVDPEQETETLTEVELRVDTPRWAGVPFLVRSGKALARDRQEVVVHLRGGDVDAQAERLTLTFDPPAVSLDLLTTPAAAPLDVPDLHLSSDVAAAPLTPYGEVLDDALRHRRLLSVTGDVAVRCWQILQPVLDGWRADSVPLRDYPAGSEGPEDSLLGD